MRYLLKKANLLEPKDAAETSALPDTAQQPGSEAK